MRERPILFSGPMVRAILEGRKTQTRRVMKRQPEFLSGGGCWYPDLPIDLYGKRQRALNCASESHFRKGVALDFSPYGVPGDRLYVKEACWLWGRWGRNGVTATGRPKWRFHQLGDRLTREKPARTAKRNGEEGWVFRHARYVPREYARIVLEVVSTRAEPVQVISTLEAMAEGADPRPVADGVVSYTHGFRVLWDSINGERPGCSWQANPWVWVVEFKRVEAQERAA
jgi:hypothetical protein